jgi:hypothetical protein
MGARLSSLLRGLIALVLLVQSGMAAGHCLRLAAAAPAPGFPVAICTAEGLVVMDLGPGADHEAPAGGHEGGVCLACHGPGQALLAAPPGLKLPSILPGPDRAGPAAEAPPAGARAPPYASRAPPARA